MTESNEPTIPPQGAGVTIQINSLAALERLIGNDPELRVQLRKSAIAAFCQRYVPKVAEAELKTAMQKVIDQHTGIQRDAWGRIRGFTPVVDKALRCELDKKLADAVTELIDHQIREAREGWMDEDELRRRVSAIYRDTIKREVNSSVRSAIKEALDGLKIGGADAKA